MLKTIAKHGSILTLGNAAAGLLNYGFIVLAARGLGPDAFGALGVLLSFFYITGALVPGIQTLTAQNVVEVESKDDQTDITRLLRSATITIGTYSLAALAVYAILSPWINTALDIGDLPAVLLVAVVCLLRALSGIFRGALQGLERFSVLAGVRFGEAAFRFTLGLLLVAIGFTLFRTTSAYLLSAIILIAGPAFFLPIKWREFWGKPPQIRETTVTTRAYMMGGAFCLLAALTQLDMLAAKYFLPAETAGHYAAATNLIKAPFVLLGGSFATAMFPSVVRARAENTGSVRLLIHTLVPVGIALGLAVSICYLLPGRIVTLLVGEEYQPLSQWLAVFAAGACAPSLLFVVARYHMVSHLRLLLVSLGIGLAAMIICLALFHTSQYHMIAAMFAGSVVPLMVLTLYTLVPADNGSNTRS